MNPKDGLTRRDTLAASLALAAAGIGRPALAQSGAQAFVCTPGTMTPRSTDGPFFKPNSPERTVLVEPGMAGTKIVLIGLVLDASCRPVPGALVDLWHADDQGRYDNAGYRLRGHQFADASGRYRFETVMPAPYVGRTRHFHVKVQARSGPVLTTQLYFPGEPGNARDGLFRKELLLAMGEESGRARGNFDFVIAAA